MQRIGPAQSSNRYKLGVTLRASADSATSFYEKKWLQGKIFLLRDQPIASSQHSSDPFSIIKLTINPSA